MSRILLMTLSLCTVILFSVIASFFSINGNTTGEIINRLPLLFIPANYVFIISWLIFIMLFFWIFNFNKTYHEMSSAHRNRVTFLFVLSCMLYIAWIFLWHFGLFTGTVITKIALLFVLLTFYSTFPNWITDCSAEPHSV